MWALGWSPDGSRLISGGNDRTAQVWDGRTGGQLLTLAGHADVIRAVAWSPRGSRLISGGDDALVHVWDARTGRQIRILRGHAETVRAVGWSPDGSWLVSCGDDGLLLLWSDSEAAPKTYLQLDALHAVAWTNAGIAVGGVSGTLVLDLE